MVAHPRIVANIAGESSGVALCISVLELLQWKEDVQNEAQLLDPLSQVLRHLLENAVQPALDMDSNANAEAMITSDEEDADVESVSADTAQR